MNNMFAYGFQLWIHAFNMDSVVTLFIEILSTEYVCKFLQ